MTPAERTAFLRSDEDDPDYLRDKSMGRCPWCDSMLDPRPMKANPSCGCRKYDDWISELANRARYQEERMAAAKIEEKSP